MMATHARIGVGQNVLWWGTISPVTSAPQPRADLAWGFQQGDEEALADAYRRWSGLVYATSLKATGNPEDAADITQAVFVNAWRGRAGFRPEAGSLSGWLMAITRRRIADHWEARSRDTRILRSVEAVAPGPESPLTSTASRRRC